MEPILFIVRAAVERLTVSLTACGQAVAALALTIALDDARGALPVDARTRSHTVTREVRLSRPVARAAPLFEHCRALLDTWTLSAPAIGITVAIVATAPLSGEQGDLLENAWRDPAAVDAALGRLRAELGPNVVVRPVRRDAHVIDRMGAWREEETAKGATASRNCSRAQLTESAKGRAQQEERNREYSEERLHLASNVSPTTCRLASSALRLLELPESVFVACDNGVPSSMTWRGRRITVERAVGPERLSGDWWDDGYRRDYWRCESAFGDFVLYLDRAGGDDAWWLQGWYD
jgi:protein ImuB